MRRKDLKQKLNEILEDPNYIPMKFSSFARAINIKDKKDRKVLGELLDKLVEQNKLVKREDKRFEQTVIKTISGKLLAHNKGFGFVRPDDDLFERDIYISPNNLNGAFDQDRVQVQIFNNPEEGERPEGRIVEIVERGREKVVGTFEKHKNFGFVTPDNDKLNKDVFVGENKFMTARNGDKVVVEITKWPGEHQNPEGKVIEVLGKPDAPGVDILSIMREHDVPVEFPTTVLDQAETISNEITSKELKNRLDLRDQTIFTIDGATSKDFDDAISIAEKENGNYELGVHIADVGHYVPADSPIDREAEKRATSIYTVNKVVPMLPFELSNNICSLVPGEDRLTYSCIMEVTKNGEVVDAVIKPSVIHSKARMVYDDVNDLFAGKNKETTEYLKPFEQDLNKMRGLADILRNIRRGGRGAIDFEFPEAMVSVDETGKPTDVTLRERGISEKLIEEFMLLANETVAAKAAKSGLTFMFRNHPHPDIEKLADFRKFIKRFGLRLGKEDSIPTNEDFQRLIHEIHGKPYENVVMLLALRTMQQAKYEAENKGHYALGAENYTHFTSPIRRYPDLTVHRNLALLEEGKLTPKDKKHIASLIKDQAAHSSEQERVADDIEREVDKMKMAEYMKDRIGNVYDATISGVTGFGFFVQLPNTIEGLVSMPSLRDDYYVFDEANQRLVGEHFGKTYGLGEAVKVKVTGADPQARQIDFEVLPKEA